MIKNIIFDVGDTLISFRYRDYMRDLGFSDETVEFLVQNMIFTDFWEDMDAGKKDVDEACDFFCKKYPDLKNEIESFWEHIEDIVAEFDFAKPLIMSMKEKGYKVFLLSNYPAQLAELHWPKLSFLPEMDGYIISAKVGIIKPDEKIYRMLMDRYRLHAEECVFIDDNPNNIEAANKLGITGILFTGYEDLKKELDKLGTG